MNNDLRAALSALGREERDGAPTLPIDALTTRAHRSRILHAATYSAIGFGAAAVLTLGALTADGLWLNREDTPVPPASEEPQQTPDRTSTAKPTPTATPTEAAWEPNWALCRMPVEDLYARDNSWDEVTGTAWWLESMWPYDTVVPVDGLLPLSLSVNGTEMAGVSVEVQLTALVALETNYETGDGWVAGVAASPTDELFQGRGTAEAAVSLGSIETRFVSCEASPLTGGDGDLDTSLTGEWYDVYGVADIRSDGGETVTAVAYLGYLGEVPEMPEEPGWEGPGFNAGWQHLTLTIGTPLRLGPTQTVELWCGTVPPTDPLRYDAVPEVALTGTGFRDGDELIAQMTLTNAGDSPLTYINLEYPYMTVSRDGWIAGSAFPHLTGFDLQGPLQPGESVQLEMSLGQSNCDGAAWPAGTYDLQVGAYLLSPVEQVDFVGYEVRTTFTLD
jgi:hypothetical protein